MKRKNIFLILMIVCSALVSGLAQKVSGNVADIDGPIPYAQVVAYDQEKIINHTETDVEGNFSLRIGNHETIKLVVHLLGKKEYSITLQAEDYDNAMVIMLEDEIFNEKPIVVYTSNPISHNAQLRIKKSDFLKMAASFDDPTRLLMKQQAFSTSNDQANSISYRGMPSHYYSWRLNGAEILNPNHLSNAGTISDLGSVNAGGVNMFSGQAISGYVFNGPSSAQNNYNTLSGNSNILSGYDDEKSIQFSLLGLEAGYGTSLSKGWKLRANYRYSFTGILGLMGVDFGGETINFQDLFVALEKTSDKTKTKIVANIGNSSNVFTHFDEPTTLKEYADINFHSKIGVLNFLHERKIKRGTIGINTAFSARSDDRDFDSSVSPTLPFAGRKTSFLVDNSKLFVNPYFKTNKYFSFGSRFVFNQSNFTFTDDLNSDAQIDDQKVDNLQILPYVNIQYYFHNRLLIEADASMLYDSYSNSALFTPHLNFTFDATERLSIAFRSSVNGQAQPEYAQLYASEALRPTINGLTELEIKSIFDKGSISLQAWNSLYVRVPTNDLRFSLFNNLDYVNLGNLTEEGSASSRGASIITEIANSKGWWLNANISLFKAKYKVDIQHYDAQNDFGQIYNLSLGKSIALKNKNSLNVSSSFHFRDGAPYFTPQNTRVSSFNYFGGPVGQLGSYSRLDLRISYEKGHSVWSLDIQNVLNKENDAFLYYDPLTESVQKQVQLGLIPILSYKYKF